MNSETAIPFWMDEKCAEAKDIQRRAIFKAGRQAGKTPQPTGENNDEQRNQEDQDTQTKAPRDCA